MTEVQFHPFCAKASPWSGLTYSQSQVLTMAHSALYVCLQEPPDCFSFHQASFCSLGVACSRRPQPLAWHFPPELLAPDWLSVNPVRGRPETRGK